MRRKQSMTLKDVINYFCNNVDIDNNGCWKNKTYKTYRDGYLRIRYNNKLENLPRLILIERHGRNFMKNYETRHLCSNRFCINPNHLIYGTHPENMKDMIKAGRLKTPDNTGSKCGTAKLTELKVKVIKSILRQNRLTHQKIAKIFGVSTTTITFIKNNKRWKHVTI